MYVDLCVENLLIITFHPQGFCSGTLKRAVQSLESDCFFRIELAGLEAMSLLIYS